MAFMQNTTKTSLIPHNIDCKIYWILQFLANSDQKTSYYIRHTKYSQMPRNDLAKVDPYKNSYKKKLNNILIKISVIFRLIKGDISSWHFSWKLTVQWISFPFLHWQDFNIPVAIFKTSRADFYLAVFEKKVRWIVYPWSHKS